MKDHEIFSKAKQCFAALQGGENKQAALDWVTFAEETLRGGSRLIRYGGAERIAEDWDIEETVLTIEGLCEIITELVEEGTP